ncbi:YigZ family protein [Ignavibacterium sp.]|uniref:IMPACT family protein n=1 Tax=Ignavibacterium sp. TaxID=2651167 RepID=UPI00307F2E98
MHFTALSSKSIPKQIKTILEFNEKIYKEKNSEFIAQAYPVESIEQSDEILGKVRKKYFDATHHCYALKLLTGETKSSDDGEPKGSAGLRIINAIEHFDLLNVMVIVIRYFGGTKLGICPLGKAYYQSAFNVIKNSKIIKMKLYQQISVQIEFNYISQFHRIVNNFEGIIDNSEYSESAKFLLSVSPDNKDSLINDLINATNSSIKYHCTNSFSYLKSLNNT